MSLLTDGINKSLSTMLLKTDLVLNTTKKSKFLLSYETPICHSCLSFHLCALHAGLSIQIPKGQEMCISRSGKYEHVLVPLVLVSGRQKGHSTDFTHQGQYIVTFCSFLGSEYHSLCCLDFEMSLANHPTLQKCSYKSMEYPFKL